MTGRPSEYLGDAVYASFDGEYIELSTTDGEMTLELIYLDRSVTNALVSFIRANTDFLSYAPTKTQEPRT